MLNCAHMTCLYIIGLAIGSVCFQDAQPIGICHPIGDGVNYCTAHIEDLPIRASWYNPSLGGINCMEPCDTLGDGTAVKDAYGWAMACPAGMYGLTLDIEHAGVWQCRDHGGDVTVRYGEVYTNDGFIDAWYLVGDFLLEKPAAWSYMLLDFEADL